MADKTSSSSLLEAIKSKLNKLDNKTTPSKINPTLDNFDNSTKQNYFNPDLDIGNIDNYNIDKTNINLSTSINNLDKVEDKLKLNNQIQENDLDIDDETTNIKKLSEKISIENKIKEIANEIHDSEINDLINLEEFEDDFESSDDNQNEAKNYQNNFSQNKDLDPIDIELMNLEKEYELTKQKSSEVKLFSNEKNNDDFKKYLDEQFENELIDIENNKTKTTLEDLPKQGLSDEINLNQTIANNPKIPNYLQNQFSPAMDYLNSLNKKGDSNKIEEKIENKIEEKVEVKKPSTEEPQTTETNLNSKTINKNNNIPEKQLPTEKLNNLPKSTENTQKPTIENIKVENLDIENLANQNSSLQKISNNSLIKEETIFQATNSFKKLVEAKNMVNQVNNFANNEVLGKIAMNLMEPKLEKWLNDNLANLVEEIVRQEIEKIVPKDK